MELGSTSQPGQIPSSPCVSIIAEPHESAKLQVERTKATEFPAIFLVHRVHLDRTSTVHLVHLVALSPHPQVDCLVDSEAEIPKKVMQGDRLREFRHPVFVLSFSLGITPLGTSLISRKHLSAKRDRETNRAPSKRRSTGFPATQP